MSARLADCASLFQLAFGLNIIPAAFAGFVDFQEKIRITLLEAVGREECEGPNIQYRDAAVTDLQRRLARRHRRVFNFIRFLVGLSLVLSTIGLLGAAEHPEIRIKNLYLDLFTAGCIVLSPLLCSLWVRICAKATRDILNSLNADNLPERIGRLIRATEASFGITDAVRSVSFKTKWTIFQMVRKDIGSVEAAKQVFRRPRHRLKETEKNA